MNKSKLLFASYFYEARNNPKWKLKLLLVILTIVSVSIISILSLDFNSMYKDLDISGDQLEMVKKIGMIGGVVGGTISSIINIAFIFIIILVVSKIMKADIKGINIFSATLSFVLLTSIIKLVVLVIQLISGISVNDYSITSLNIFDKGNEFLGAFDLQSLIAAYLFSLVFYLTSRLSGILSILLGVVYLVCVIAFAIVGANFK